MNSPLAQTQPATMSEAPLMNLVRLWMTTSAPCSAGVTATGAKVLSTTRLAPRSCAMRASAGRSATRSVGLESVSQ